MTSQNQGQDLQLRHESIDQAFEELVQAGKTMKNDMDTLVSTLTGIQEHFTGQAAQAFQDFLKVVSDNEGAMSDDIHQGAITLDTMHQTMKYADQAAAAGF